jgi:hypothetical protein
MRLFTENVDFIATSGDKNILQIENYEEDFSNTEKIFKNKIKELITEIYNNQVIKIINDGIDKISQQSEVSFENIKNDFDSALSEKATSVDLKNVENGKDFLCSE